MQSSHSKSVSRRGSLFNPLKLLALFLLLAMVAVTPGCSSTSASDQTADYPARYQQELASLSDDPLTRNQQELRRQFAPFIAFFSELEPEGLVQRAEAVYAEALYFNDTLKTFSSRDSLISYLKETAERVEYNRVSITNIIPFGDDYFMQWHMESGFKVFGKLIATESIGMTHIRLDEDGRVNFHQDFWDNTEGLFRHLPGVGYVVTKARNRL